MTILRQMPTLSRLAMKRKPLVGMIGVVRGLADISPLTKPTLCLAYEPGLGVSIDYPAIVEILIQQLDGMPERTCTDYSICFTHSSDPFR